MTQYYADPGTEQYIPFAKTKLAFWKTQYAGAGVPSFHKRIDVSDGSTIYVDSTALGQGRYNDRIRITGGGAWVCADPVQHLWGTYDSLLPATRGDSMGNPQHITTTYLKRPRVLASPVGSTVVPGAPATPFSPGTPDTTVPGATVTVDQEKTIKHELVVCRYCRRVAVYTWDEVWAYDDATFVATGVESGYAVTGLYDWHDDVTVSLKDRHANLTDYNRRAVPHGLEAQWLADPWGWWGEGVTPAKPAEPMQKLYGVTIEVLSGGVGSGGTHVIQYSVKDQFGDTLTSGSESGTLTSTTYPDGTLGPANGYPDIAYDISGEVPAWEGNFLISPNPLHCFPTGHYEDWGQPGGGIPATYHTSPTYATMVAAAASANDAAAAQFSTDVQTYTAAWMTILSGIASMLEVKLGTDGAELVPHPGFPYEDQQAVYIMPAAATATVTATYSGVSKDHTFMSRHKIVSVVAGAINNMVPNLTLTAKDTTPTPPYRSVMQRPVKFKFTPATKVFELVPEVVVGGVPQSWYTYKKAYFSAGADLTHLEALHTDVRSWGAMYRTKATSATSDVFASVFTVGDGVAPPVNRWVAPDAFMKEMCVGVTGNGWRFSDFLDISLMCYNAFFTKRGATWRQTEHTHTRSDYVVVQATIPNTDAPNPI